MKKLLFILIIIPFFAVGQTKIRNTQLTSGNQIAGKVLKSDGATNVVWGTDEIGAPSAGSANYVQVQTATHQPGSMDLAGSGYFGSTIQATTAKLTNLTDGYIPYHISDVNGLGNSNMRQVLTGVAAGAITITNAGDTKYILQLDAERAWAFQQIGTGDSTRLRFADLTGGKTFEIFDVIAGFKTAEFSSVQSIFYSSGNEKLRTTSSGITVTGVIDAASYKMSGINLLLDSHKSGSLGASGYIYTGAGTSTTPTWQTLNQVIGANALVTNRLVKWDGSKLISIPDGTSGQSLKTDGSGVYTFKTDTLFTTIAISDETTALTTRTAKITFRMPIACTLTKVRASATTAPTGSTLIFDINEGGTSVLSTKLSIDATEKTSKTAASQAVISDSSIANDAEMTIDIDQIGSTIAGAGAKIILYYIRN